MSPRALVPLAPGFEEIEAVTIIDVLRRGGVEVVVAALGASLEVEGSHGITLLADAHLAELDEGFEAIVLPGGMPGAAALRDDLGLRARLQAQHAAGRICGAICAAPIALEAAGVLAGRRATSYPSFRAKLASAELADAPVVEDGPIVTSAGPGTALPFALALVRRLRSADEARRLAEAMLAPSAA